MMKSVAAILFLLFVSQVHAFYPDILLNDLIHDTCRQTPYYDLCVRTLESDPESSHADLEGLAEIMVGNLNSRAALTLHRIKHMLHGTNIESEMTKVLRSCARSYKAIVRSDVPRIFESLEKGNYKSAEHGTRVAAIEARSCENAFPGRSPLTRMNQLVHDTSVVAASIVQIIMGA